MAKSSKKNPNIGDVVLVKQGIGIVRYVGPVDFDPDETYLGIEIKGPPVTGGTNGSQNGKSYFKCQNKRGIFVKNVIRKVTNEEILDKCAHLYDVVQGRTNIQKNKGNKHFIDRNTYNNLLEEYNLLKARYQSLDKSINEYDKMVVQYAILREKMGFMEGNYSKKIDENAALNEKISNAERKLGTRLSQMDMSNIMKQLKNDKNDEFKVPDYGAIYGTNDDVNGQNGHHRRKSTLTTALENEENDFSKIAADVANDIYAPNNINLVKQDNGKKKRGSVDINNDEIVEKVISSNQKTPTHFRKFSNTTKIVLKKNEEKKKAEKGVNIEKGSFRSVKARSSMDMSNAQELQEITNTKPSRQSRDSVDINNAELAEINKPNNSHKSRDSTTIDNFEPKYENEDELSDDNNNNNNINNVNNNNNNNISKHPKARDSIDLESNEISQINKPSRESRESKTLNNDDIMNNLKNEIDDNYNDDTQDNIDVEDDPFGDKLAMKMKENKKNKHINTMSANVEDFEKPAMDITNIDDPDDEF